MKAELLHVAVHCVTLSNPTHWGLQFSLWKVTVGGRWWSSSVSPLRCCFNFCSNFRCWCLFVFTLILVNHSSLCLISFLCIWLSNYLLVTRLYCSIKGLIFLHLHLRVLLFSFCFDFQHRGMFGHFSKWNTCKLQYDTHAKLLSALAKSGLPRHFMLPLGAI